jgi:ankyrin repeat protein
MNANFSASRVVPNVIARKTPRVKSNQSVTQNNTNRTRRGKGGLGLGMNRSFASAPANNSEANKSNGNNRNWSQGVTHVNQGSGKGKGSGKGTKKGKDKGKGKGKGYYMSKKNYKRLKLGIPLIPNNSNTNNENNQEYNENQENNQENNDESYAETIRMAIVRAIAKNENETLSYFLETYPDYVDLTNDAGETALFYAVTRNNEDAVNILLMNGADIDHQNNQDETALFIAAQENNAQMVDLLLSLGADPDIESEFGEKPINIAASQGYAKLIPKFPRLPMPKDVHIRLALDDSDMAQYIPDGIFESITDSVFYAAKDVMANPNLCVGIGAAFKEGSYENATHLIIVEDNEGTVLGASSLQVNFDNDWFEIDLFCSDYRYKGVGSYMMDAIKKLKTHWDRKIKLKSVNDAHNFYIKQGFTNNAEPKTANGLTKMTYS